MKRLSNVLPNISIILLVSGLFGIWYLQVSNANSSADHKDKIIQDLIDYNNTIREQAQAGGIEVPPIPDTITGKSGEMGPRGIPGVNGAPGAQGVPGVDGKDGAPGPSGLNGSNGTDGANGTNGVDGQDGKLPPSYEIHHDDGSVETCNLQSDQSYDCTETTPPTTTTTATTLLTVN